VLDNDDKWESTRRRRGDIVSVFPDGHEWGTAERLPDYVSLDMTGVPVSEMVPYTRHSESQIVDRRGKPFLKHKRNFSLQFEELPSAVLAGLNRDGKADVSYAEIKGRILNRETGLRQ